MCVEPADGDFVCDCGRLHAAADEREAANAAQTNSGENSADVGDDDDDDDDDASGGDADRQVCGGMRADATKRIFEPAAITHATIHALKQRGKRTR